MLLKEEDWYKSQKIDEPFVQFFNNSHIVGMFCFDFFGIEEKSYNHLVGENSIQMNINYFLFHPELFDHKSKGIFSLLDDESKVREPSVQNFTSKLRSVWDNHSDVADLNLRAINLLHTPKNTFTIRHFAGVVRYSTVKILFSFHLNFFYVFLFFIERFCRKKSGNYTTFSTENPPKFVYTASKIQF